MDKHHSILIATKEKALADTLYFSDKISDEVQMEKYLFEDLRLNRKEVIDFNLRKVKNLAGLYRHNVSIFSNLLRSMK